MDLNVARAVFTSALLRSDPPAPDVKREDAALFVKTLLKAANICTKTDVKTCKAFIIRSILPSAPRTAALAKYLLILSKACAPREPSSRVDTTKGGDEFEGLGRIVRGKVQQPPDPVYRRLHILYVVHDVLAFAALKLRKDLEHARVHVLNPIALEHLQNAVPPLAQLAVCGDGKSLGVAKEALRQVEDLLALWRTHEILPTPITSGLSISLTDTSTMRFSNLLSNLAADEAQAALATQRAKEEASKWNVPSTHHLPHDASAPWHELPAANGLYQKRTRGYPLRASGLPPGGYSLRNAGRKADPAMQKDVEDLLSEAKRCFDRFTDPNEVQDVDALGNIIWKAGTGRKRRNYWGWSYETIEKRRRDTEQI